MQKTRLLIFPCLGLLLLLLLGAYCLGRNAFQGAILIPAHPDAPAETGAAQSEIPRDKTLSPAETERPRLDLNTATLEELMELPGIGPTLARRILEDRETNGPFRVPSDLLRVPGIGQITYENLRDLVTVEEYDENTDH